MVDSAIEGRAATTRRFETSWLLVRDDLGAGPPQVLTLGAGLDGRVLPIFSFEEEAQLFLRLGGLGGGWHASRRGAADLVSVLLDACPDARRIALDPIPEIGPHGPHDLVSLSREDFVGLLTGRR
jgi:hypothetical protein